MPSPPQPVADLLADLARGLRALGVRWFLFGAQAAILHGAARLSADVDVTVDLGTRSSRPCKTDRLCTMSQFREENQSDAILPMGGEIAVALLEGKKAMS